VIVAFSESRTAIQEPLLDGHLGDATEHGDGHGAAELFDTPARRGSNRLDPALAAERHGAEGEGRKDQDGGTEARVHRFDPLGVAKRDVRGGE
jgi:hypothetical protein